MIRRHSLIAQLRSNEADAVRPIDTHAEVTPIDFVNEEGELQHGIGQIIHDLAGLGMSPSEVAVDLAILAATVFAADTRISRISESQDSWTREIDLYIPVLNPPLWIENAPLLERLLNFLTGDRWRLVFRPRPRETDILVPAIDLMEVPYDSVCLFSGGLDSFTGTIDLLEQGRNPLFVSHYADTSTSSQVPCSETLTEQYEIASDQFLRTYLAFPSALVRDSETEPTTRGRSFWFIALASLAASAFQGPTPIYVPENGLISLNVPLDPLRLGAWSTRTTHPFYMARWQQILSNLGLAAQLINPYRFKTKGEMLGECRNREFLQEHLAKTISCSSISKSRWRRESNRQCGFCTPCLIRRAAIHTAFTNDPTEYSLDLFAHSLNAKAAEGTDVRSFMFMHARLMRAPYLAQVLVHKTGPLSDYSLDEIDQYGRVFARGINEIGDYLRNATTIAE